jgi:hypothetical protein
MSSRNSCVSASCDRCMHCSHKYKLSPLPTICDDDCKSNPSSIQQGCLTASRARGSSWRFSAALRAVISVLKLRHRITARRNDDRKPVSTATIVSGFADEVDPVKEHYDNETNEATSDSRIRRSAADHGKTQDGLVPTKYHVSRSLEGSSEKPRSGRSEETCADFQYDDSKRLKTIFGDSRDHRSTSPAIHGSSLMERIDADSANQSCCSAEYAANIGTSASERDEEDHVSRLVANILYCFDMS